MTGWLVNRVNRDTEAEAFVIWALRSLEMRCSGYTYDIYLQETAVNQQWLLYLAVITIWKYELYLMVSNIFNLTIYVMIQAKVYCHFRWAPVPTLNVCLNWNVLTIFIFMLQRPGFLSWLCVTCGFCWKQLLDYNYNKCCYCQLKLQLLNIVFNLKEGWNNLNDKYWIQKKKYKIKIYIYNVALVVQPNRKFK